MLLYVPAITPTSSTSRKFWMVTPPIRNIAMIVSTVTNDVLIDRTSVSVRLTFTASEKGTSASREVTSRTRSNTTIVSCTEKPITVRIATMKAVSTSVPVTFASSENSPSTITESCTSAITAQSPYRQGARCLRNANAT